jgi:hypothetical protein
MYREMIALFAVFSNFWKALNALKVPRKAFLKDLKFTQKLPKMLHLKLFHEALIFHEVLRFLVLKYSTPNK